MIGKTKEIIIEFSENEDSKLSKSFDTKAFKLFNWVKSGLNNTKKTKILTIK